MAQRAIGIGLLVLGLVGCGAGHDDPVAIVADEPPGPPVGSKRSAVIVGDELRFLRDDAVESSVDLPAAFDPAMVGFGHISAAVTADRRHLAYLGWDPAPALARLEDGGAVDPGTPLGVQVLHILDLSSGEHAEVRGVESFALRSSGDIAYARTPDPAVRSQSPQNASLIYRTTSGDEVVVSDGGHSTAAIWSDDLLLYTIAPNSEPGPFTLMAYSPTAGTSVRVGEGLSPFATIEDGGVVVVPNFESFPENFQLYDSNSGDLVDLDFDGPEEISRGIRVIGRGLFEDGWIVFHGQREPSSVEVVGRMKVVDGSVAVSDLVDLDTRSIAGIEQIHTTRDGRIAGWGLNPKAIPSQGRDADPDSPRLVEFVCRDECKYEDVSSQPVVQVTVISRGWGRRGRGRSQLPGGRVRAATAPDVAATP